MKKLATTAAILATIVVICFATLQLSGRVLCWQLPRLEGTINRLLAARGIAVHGIEGRWHGLNAGFFAEWVRFPAGEMFGLDFELDMLESLARNRVVARRLTVADGYLAFENTVDGWRLRESAGPNMGDATSLLLHSDEVWLRGRVVAQDDDLEATMQVETMLINQDGEHRFHVSVQSEPNCIDCALTVDGMVHDDGMGEAQAVATRFSLDRDLEIMLGAAGTLRHAPGTTSPAVFAVRGDWQRDATGAAKARLDVAADIPSPTGGHPARLTTTLTAWSEADGYRGRIAKIAAASGDAKAQLADGGFRFAANDDAPVLDVWLPTMDIAALASPVAEFLGDDHGSGRWLRHLAPGGQVRGFVLRADHAGLAFGGRGTEGSLAGYKGVPKLANVNFVFGGHGRALRMRLDGEQLTLAFPNFFPSQAPFERAGGVLTFAFAPGYIGLRGTEFWGEQGGARGDGGFAWTRPSDPLEARVSADFAFDHADLALARAYLPLTLQPRLRRWLVDGVHAGRFQDGRLLYHGHVKQENRNTGNATARRVNKRALRRIELVARIFGGTLDYHADWPLASDFDGVLALTHDWIRLRGRGRAFDTALTDVDLRTPRTAEYTRVRFAGVAPARRVLRFAHATPTREAMPFLADAWSAEGEVDFRADLTVPLRGQGLRPGDIRLDLRLQDAMVDLADLGLRFERLRGSVSFASPHGLSTPADSPLDGALFGAPARVAFTTDDSGVQVRVAGTAATTDALRLLNTGDLDMVTGKTHFNATLSVFPSSARAPELVLDSNLKGVTVTLPAPLGKAASDTLPTRVGLHFLDDHIAVSMRYGAADGWLHVRTGEVRAGAVGVGAPVPMVDAAHRRVVIAGALDALDAHTVAALMTAAEAEGTGFAWELRQFRVGELALESARLHDVILDGYADHGDLHFDLLGREVEGMATKTGDDPWQLRLNVLRLPALKSEGQRLSVEVIDRLVDADVVIGDVRIGDANYGKWKFGLRRQDDGVMLLGIEGKDVRGLDIVGAAPAFWSKAGETSFAGTVRTNDVRTALTAWEFAPSVEAERFEATGELRWPGSPFDFALAHITGNAALRLDTGRFLTVEPGGARIMSLINFSEILRRMRLDFSDVFGRGSDFDKVRAELVVNNGLAHFAQPARITGSAASLRIGGTVDFGTGILDNEMIVTVSVLHRNLPWYAALLAFSNPASAAGVLLGSQVLFKDQIKQFSSGKYTIGGTYDDPEVKFVGIWREDIATPTIPQTSTNAPPAAVARHERH